MRSATELIASLRRDVAPAPQHAPAHELRATPLLLPGVTSIDLDGALANGLPELALDRPDGRRSVFHILGSETGFPGPILFGASGLGDIPLNRPAASR
jgi:hypothetical protein